MKSIERRAIWFSWVLLGVGALSAANPARAFDLNGFFPGEHTGHVALSYSFESYDHFFRGTTKVSNPGGLGEVEIATYSVYFDYGLTDRLAVVVNLPGVDADSDGTAGFAENDLQDLTALVKYRAASYGSGARRHSLVIAGGLRTPISDYVADAPVSVGDGSTDFLGRFIYQFESGRFYLSQQVGLDLRGEDVPNGLSLYTELGFKRGRVLVSGFLAHYLADGGSDIGDSGFTFPGNQEEYTRVGAKVYTELGTRLGLSGLVFTTLDGRNTGEITGGAVGVVARFF